MKFRDILLALCAPLLLGFGFAIAKPAMQQFPPFLLMGLRFTIAALVLIWWFPIPKKLLKDLFIVSLIGGTLTYGLVYMGLNSVDASSSILLVHTEVPFGVIIAYFLFKERPGIKNILGIIIAFIGLFVLLGAPNLEGKLIGVLLLLFGAFFWSLGMVMAKPLSKKIGGFAVAAWISLFCGPMLLLGSFIFDGNTMNYFLSADYKGWLIVAYLALIMQPLAYGTWYHVMGRNPVHKVMPVMLLLPLTGLSTAIFLLGEEPTKQVFIGGAIILFGIGMILFSRPSTK
jgi:O-acetylserine/cysteine efflux transporter